MGYDGPPWPAHYQTGTVHGQYLASDGTPQQDDNQDGPGSLTFTARPANVLAFSDGVDIVTSPVTVLLDPDDGTFSVELPATDDPDVLPYKFTYEVVENWTGGRTFDCEVPNGVDSNLFDVAPLEPSTGMMRYFGRPGTNGTNGSAGSVAMAIVFGA